MIFIALLGCDEGCLLHSDCPAQQRCFQGACLASCDDARPCAEGRCLEGVCQPCPSGLCAPDLPVLLPDALVDAATDGGADAADGGADAADGGTDAADGGTDTADGGADAADGGTDAADGGTDAADGGADAADLDARAEDGALDARSPLMDQGRDAVSALDRGLDVGTDAVISAD
ncbi:hypothetical protein KJ940_07665 [Myxococcota bacterium]|nr:hypothetical protein [Myxococcota bacterium]